MRLFLNNEKKLIWELQRQEESSKSQKSWKTGISQHFVHNLFKGKSVVKNISIVIRRSKIFI